MITVSIVIPIYNVEAYIERCLRSVIAQDYPFIECILVNDCTPDNSVSICEQLIAEYDGSIQFKILHHDRNRGLSAARNTGTDAATSEYIYYLDSDDEITQTCISLLTKEIELNPELELVQGNTQPSPFKEGYLVDTAKEPLHILTNQKIRYHAFKIANGLPVNAWNKLVSKDFLKRNHISFLEGLIHEDVLWSFFVYNRLTKLSMIPDITYIHYITENSIMTTTSLTRSGCNWAKILDKISHNITPPHLQLMLYKYSYKSVEWIPFAYSSPQYYKCIFPFFIQLFRLHRRKLAARYLLFTLLYPLHRGHLCGKTPDVLKLAWHEESQRINQDSL